MSDYQQQRFEYKYVIPEALAPRVRDFVATYLELDSYGARHEDCSYSVNSLYLDSDDLQLYQSTVNGDKNRYKLRIRYYDTEGDSPLFFEIKSRRDNIISKRRAKVRRASLMRLLDGDQPAPEDLVDPGPKDYADLARFCELHRALQARPQTRIFYRREAWLPALDNAVRVTFDRCVGTEPDREARLPVGHDALRSVFGDQVILELKFTDRFPDWMRTLVRTFHLPQMSAAKYADGIDVLDASGLRPLDACRRLHPASVAPFSRA